MDLPVTLDAPTRWLDLSTAQRSIWLDMQLQDEPAAYQLGGWACVDAALDPALASQAARLVAARNDVVLGIALHRRDAAPRETLGQFAGLLPGRCAADAQATLDETVAAIGNALDDDVRDRRVSIDAIGRALGQGRGEPLVEVVASHVLVEAAPPPLTLSDTPLINAEGQHSLWPALTEPPAGWRAITPPQLQDTCLAYVNTVWTDLRPLSLRNSAAA